MSRTTIQRFVNATSSDSLRIFDVNLRKPFYSDDVIRTSLDLANVLKLNDEELPILAEMFDLAGTDLESLKGLASLHQLKCVALTRGENGALIIRGDGVVEQPGIPTQVVDTVGAGDAFTAALTLGLLDELDLEAIIQNASRIAAFVCSQSGATPQLPTDLVASTSRQ